MDDVNPIPIESLFAHRGWVRGLARRLVYDDSQVDDVEQMTWLAALERPPRRGQPRAWLAAVVRNVASKTRRGEIRLRERHLAAPGRPSPDEPGDVLARAELHGRLVNELLALDEPYRQTLLLRFFERLPPREVARLMDAPVETVRVRTRRALERLRRRLDATHGSRRGWMLAYAPLAGLRPETVGGSVPASGLGVLTVTVSTKTKLLIGLLVALLLALWVVPRLGREDALPAERDPALVATASPAPPVLKGTGAPAGEGAPDVTAPAAPDPVARASEVVVSFVDENGLRLSPAEIAARREASGGEAVVRLVREEDLAGESFVQSQLRSPDSWQHAAALVVRDGALTIEPPPEAGLWRLFLSRPGWSPYLSPPFRVEASGAHEIEVPLPSASSPRRLRLLDAETQQPVAGARVVPLYTHGDDVARFQGAARFSDDFGAIAIPEDDRAGTAAPDWWISTETRGRVLREHHIRRIVREDDGVVLLAAHAAVYGCAWTPGGEPAIGCPVLAWVNGVIFRTVVAEDGTYAFPRLPVPPAGVNDPPLGVYVVYGSQQARGGEIAPPAPGSRYRHDIGRPASLEAGGAIVLRVTCGEHPIPGLMAEIVPDGRSDGSGPIYGHTDADGRCELEGLPQGSYKLRITLGDWQVNHRYRIESTGHLDVRGGEPVPQAFALPSGVVRLRLVDAESGEPIARGGAFTLPQEAQKDSERFPGFVWTVGWAAYSDATGLAVLRGLPRGGLVSVSVSKDGYERLRLDNVVVRDIDEDPETVSIPMRSPGAR